MKIKQTVFMVALVLGVIALFVAPTVSAATSCGEVDTAIIKCDVTPGNEIENTGLWAVLMMAINILSAGIAVAAIGGIIYGAILYTSAGGSSEQVKKAMGIMTNTVIGIIAYALMWSFLNFIIPGGVF